MCEIIKEFFYDNPAILLMKASHKKKTREIIKELKLLLGLSLTI
jgi:hypothetical protein